MCHIKDLTLSYKISGSKKNINSLCKLGIKVDDLTNHNIYIKHNNNVSQVEGNVLYINTRNYGKISDNDIDKNNYYIFDIYNLESYNYAIIDKKSIDNNYGFNTINHNSHNRASNDRELVFMYVLAKKYNLNLHNGNNWERYNYTWDLILEAHFEQFPKQQDKILSQIELLSSTFDMKQYSYLVKDQHSFTINKIAKELFFNTYTDKGYTFEYNKWCPADIWLLSDNYLTNIHNKKIFNKLNIFNEYIKKSIINKRDILPVSLKMNMNTTDSTIDYINMSPYNYTYEYIDNSIANYPSMSTYINYYYINIDSGKRSLGKIELRNFKGKYSLIGAELKGGSYYRDGKLTAMFFPLFGKEFKEKQLFIKNSSNSELLDNIDYLNMKKYKDTFLKYLYNPSDYRNNTILQSILLIDYLESHPNGVNYCLSEMVRFGRSMSDVSAPHILLK